MDMRKVHTQQQLLAPTIVAIGETNRPGLHHSTSLQHHVDKMSGQVHVKVAVTGNPDRFEQQLLALARLLRSHKSINPFNLVHAGILYDVANCLSIRFDGEPGENTFWTRLVIVGAIEDAASQGPVDKVSFLKALRSRLGKRRRALPASDYLVVVPLDFSGFHDSGRSWIPGIANRLYFRTSSSVSHGIDLNTAWTKTDQFLRRHNLRHTLGWDCLVQIFLEKTTFDQAADWAELEVNALRVLVNMLQTCTSFHFQSSVSWTPSYPFPAWLVGYAFDVQKGSFHDSFWNSTSLRFFSDFHKSILDKGGFQTALALHAELRRAPPDIRFALANLLFQFQEALDIPLPHLAFFSLWRVLELVFLFTGRERVHYEDLASTIAALFDGDKQVAESVRATLHVLSEKRHRFVHRAEWKGIDNYDCSILRILVSQVLVWLIKYASKATSLQNLGLILRHYSTEPEQVLQLDEALRTIKALRHLR